MKESTSDSMGELISSINNIGERYNEVEFKSKKIIEKLKKCRIDLAQESFDSAFSPDSTGKG